MWSGPVVVTSRRRITGGGGADGASSAASSTATSSAGLTMSPARRGGRGGRKGSGEGCAPWMWVLYLVLLFLALAVGVLVGQGWRQGKAGGGGPMHALTQTTEVEQVSGQQPPCAQSSQKPMHAQSLSLADFGAAPPPATQQAGGDAQDAAGGEDEAGREADREGDGSLARDVTRRVERCLVAWAANADPEYGLYSNEEIVARKLGQGNGVQSRSRGGARGGGGKGGERQRNMLGDIRRQAASLQQQVAGQGVRVGTREAPILQTAPKWCPRVRRQGGPAVGRSGGVGIVPNYLEAWQTVLPQYAWGKGMPQDGLAISSNPKMGGLRDCNRILAMQVGWNRKTDSCAVVSWRETQPGDDARATSMLASNIFRVNPPRPFRVGVPEARIAYHQDLELLFRHMEDLEMNLRITLQEAANEENDVVVLVVNSGMLDLLANFICSAHRAHVDVSNVVVFASDKQTAQNLENMGIHSFYHSGLGDYPASAARAYGDITFRRMMMLKLTSVYLSLRLGFNVLFQDVDLVWFRDPWEYFHDRPEFDDVDVFIMDDGARTQRFAPLFGNSGFYYLRQNPRSLQFMQSLFNLFEKIYHMHSHQHIMDVVLIEQLHLHGLNVLVLNDEEFPQGKVYHHKKDLMNSILEKKTRPYLFHMCWTLNKVEKLRYLKGMKMWYLESPTCDNDNIPDAARESHKTVPTGDPAAVALAFARSCCVMTRDLYTLAA